MGAKDYLNSVVAGGHTMSRVYDIRSDEMKLVFIKQAISDYRELAQNAIMDDGQFPEFADFRAHVRRLQQDQQRARMPVLQ